MTLGNRGADAPPAALAALIAVAATEPEAAVRVEIARALGAVGKGHDETVAPLARLLADRDVGVRKSAADWLGRLGAPAGARALIDALHDGDSGVRASAAKALGAEGLAPTATAAVPALAAALSDAADEVWGNAGHSLAAYGAAAAPAIPALQRMMQSGDSARRQAGASALAGIGPDAAAAAPECVAALDDESAETRVEAAIALLSMRREQARGAQTLVAALSFQPGSRRIDDVWLRRAVVARAAWALGEYSALAPPEAAPRLAALVSDRDADVRRFARPALRAVTTALVAARRSEALSALQQAHEVLKGGGDATALDAIAVEDAMAALPRRMPSEIIAAAAAALLMLAIVATLVWRRAGRVGAPRVLLSYRRVDSAAVCGRLYDHLVARWGAERVFRDIDSIAPGDAFAARIDAAIRTCDAVLVLIGPGWVGATDGGARRIDDTADFVRIEIATALAQDKRVIPVLHDGATMPAADTLPPEIAALAMRNALELSDAHFGADVAVLITACTAHG